MHLGLAFTDEQPRRPRFLIDNSAWQRVQSEPTVREAIEGIIRTTAPDDILICPPIAAEYGYSARSEADHVRMVGTLLSAFSDCSVKPDVKDSFEVQAALFAAGMGRAAGAIDVLIATYALVNDATVLHYDRDFEHIARAFSPFKQQWVVPAGSL